MRTLVLSDLHLGSGNARDVLRRRSPLAALCAAVEGADRVVLLGDTLELRHGPLRDAVAVAQPVFAALGAALGPGGEVVLVAGNHDHALVAPWLDERGQDGAPPPLGLETRGGPATSWAVGRLAAAVASGGARLDTAHPGVWVRHDVWATHGHYLDRRITVPTFERLAAGVMGRVAGALPARQAEPEDFEAALAPMYAWMQAVAQGKRPGFTAKRQGASAATWSALTGRRRTLRARALGLAVPVAVAGVNRAGLGPVRAELSAVELRRAGLKAMGEVVDLLGVRAEHVLFGHTHRSGPHPTDDVGEWRTATGVRLHNAGSWIDEPLFATGGPASPYWAGRVLVVEDEGPPRLERVVSDLG